MNSEYNRKYQKEFRQKLRREATWYEKVLWSKLRGRQLKGRKFRRQAGFGKYIADFYCPSEKLVVELDGAYHSSESISVFDRERDLFFKSRGIRVLRIRNPKDREALENALLIIASHFKPKKKY